MAESKEEEDIKVAEEEMVIGVDLIVREMDVDMEVVAEVGKAEVEMREVVVIAVLAMILEELGTVGLGTNANSITVEAAVEAAASEVEAEEEVGVKEGAAEATVVEMIEAEAEEEAIQALVVNKLILRSLQDNQFLFT